MRFPNLSSLPRFCLSPSQPLAQTTPDGLLREFCGSWYEVNWIRLKSHLV
jgi:hypothetical protein